MADLYSTLTPVFEDADGVNLYRGGEEYVSFASTDFLGITQDKKVKQTIAAALTNEASVLTGSAISGGFRPIHQRVESRISAFKASEVSLIFSSLIQAYTSLVSAYREDGKFALLADSFSKELVDHFKALDIQVVTFKSGEPDSLESLFAKQQELKGAPVFVESLSTQEGEVAPLRELDKVCKKNGSTLIVDESLAVGVLGILGSGGIEMAGLNGKDIISITGFQHSLGFLGASASGSKKDIDKILESDSTYYEQPLMPAPQLHGLEAAIGLIELEVRKRSKLRTNSLQLRDGLRSMGYKFAGDPVSPVIRISLGNPVLNQELVKGFFERKFIVAAGAENAARIMVSSEHQSKHISDFLQVAEDVGKRIDALG